MHRSSVPKAANLDILTETVTDTGAPPSAIPQMGPLFAELDKAVSEAAAIIGSAAADQTPTATVSLRTKTEGERSGFFSRSLVEKRVVHQLR